MGLAGHRLGHLSSCSTPCEAWLACASIAVPAWVRIWLRVNPTISCAMSASRMRLSEAVRFSTPTLRLLMVWSNRFWMAPRSARVVETVPIAVSSRLIADCAPLAAVKDGVARASSAAVVPVAPAASVYPAMLAGVVKVRVVVAAPNGVAPAGRPKGGGAGLFSTGRDWGGGTGGGGVVSPSAVGE